MICRICKDMPEASGTKLLKYGVRAYAHYRCWLQLNVARLPTPKTTHAIAELLMTLHSWQLREMPLSALADELESYGLRARAVNLLSKVIRTKQRAEKLPRCVPSR